MNIFVNDCGGSWEKVTTAETEAIKEQYRLEWQEFKRLIGKREEIRLRDLTFAVNKILDANAYNASVQALTRFYQDQVTEKSLTDIADKPLRALYNAPYLADDNVPILASTLKNQCYLKEDYFDETPKGKKILICVTGRRHNLNMPLAAFHSYSTQIFDGIIYFFDTSKSHYKGKKKHLSRSVDELLTLLNPSNLGFWGTSAGACPAIKLYLENTESKVMAASPLFDMYPEITEKLFKMDNKKLKTSFKATYAENPIDKRFEDIYQKLVSKAGVSTINNMTYIRRSHSSLSSTLTSQEFVKILKWLSGESSRKQTEKS